MVSGSVKIIKSDISRYFGKKQIGALVKNQLKN